MWGKVRKLWEKPSFSNVVALLALFIALGGASYAAVKIPKNSVGTAQLKKNAVNSAKVKDRSLLAADFKKGQLPSGPKGAAGANGTTGATGATGPSTTAMLTGVTELTTGDRYFGVSGKTTAVAKANLQQVAMSALPVATTASNLTATFDDQPSGPNSRTISLVKVSDLFTGGTAEVTPLGLSCTVNEKYICTTTDSVSIPAWTQLAMLATSTGSPDPTWVRFSLAIGP